MEFTENDSSLATPETSDTTRPSLSHDQYIELMTLRFKTTELKANSYDLTQMVAPLQAQLDEYTKILNANNEELANTLSTFQSKYEEFVVKPFNAEGKNVKIEDSEPHFITFE